MARHPLGWRPDPPDVRDLHYAAPRRLFGLLRAAPPRQADLHLLLPAAGAAIRNQKTLGCCTGFGNTYAVAFAHWKATGQWLGLSELFAYYGERVLEGTVNQDAGAQIRDGIKVAHQTGICAQSAWPYVMSKFKDKPSAAAFADAANRKITAYHRVITLDDIKACIGIDGYPVVFGFTCYESLEGEECARTGIIPLPQPHEKVIGGHCLVWDAYDDATGMLSGPNWWTGDWGDHGRFHMPYAYVTKGIASDKWTVRK